MNVVSHVNEDDLEQYAMHTLRASACATLEEHLLICSECRERMDAEMEFLAAMKSAAVSFRKQGKNCQAQGSELLSQLRAFVTGRAIFGTRPRQV